MLSRSVRECGRDGGACRRQKEDQICRGVAPCKLARAAMGKAMQPKPASSTHLLALPEGTELVGDYRIKRVLGGGGFGITYLAGEFARGRLVTVKEYFPADFAARLGTINASPRSQGCAEDFRWGLDRFISEAQTLAS